MRLLLVLFAVISVIKCYCFHHENLFCQAWCYRSIDNTLHIQCCSYLEKPGFCPSGCQFPGQYFSLHFIACQSDINCRKGFKCCTDSCFPYYKICRPAQFETAATMTVSTVTSGDLTNYTKSSIPNTTEGQKSIGFM